MGKINHGLYERPFGRLPGIGLGLALFLYAAAVMLVLNRLIPAWLSEEASRRYAQNAGLWTAVVFGTGTLCLYGIAAKLTDSVVDMAAFLLGAAASVCRILSALLPRLISAVPTAVPAAAASLLFWMLTIASFLLIWTNRENTRDARCSAAAALPFLLLCFLGNAAAFYGANLVVQARADVAFRGLRLLSFGERISLFAGIAAYIAMAMTFLFLRTPTRAIQYPKVIED